MPKPNRHQAEPDAPTATLAHTTDADGLTSALSALRPPTHLPELQQAADVISATYRQERQDTPLGRIGFLGHAAKLSSYFHALNTGLSPQQAGYAIGMAGGTISTHYEQGLDEYKAGNTESAHALFYVATEMLKAHIEGRCLERIEQAGQKDQNWTALAWKLERSPMFANRYKLQQVTGTASVIVNVGIMAQGDVRIGLGTDNTNALPDVVIPSNAVSATDTTT